MATAHITMRNAVSLGAASVYGPVRAAETIDSGATSEATTIASRINEVITVTAVEDVFVALGDDPTAASGAGDLITAGGTRDFSGYPAGTKVAVIDA